MAKNKISPRLQQATKDYLTSLGSSREKLTDEQWESVADCVKSRRRVKLIVVSCLVLGLALFCITALYFHWTKYEIAKATPNQTVFFFKAGEKSVIPLKPWEIKNYLTSLASLSLNTGIAFFLAVFLCLSALIIPLQKQRKRKMLEAFIRPAKNPQKTPPED